MDLIHIKTIQEKLIRDDIPSLETRGQLYMWMKEVS
jgi:hypothetical protein